MRKMITGEEEASNGVSSLPKDESINLTVGANEEIRTKNDSKLKKQILYEVGADALVEFKNGDSIKINKSLLAYHSPVFADQFFGESATTTVKIDDFDCGTFRTFLDCLFEFKECTVFDALLIYPIAHKYNVRKLIQICQGLLPNTCCDNVYFTVNVEDNGEIEVLGISFLNLNVVFFNVLENNSNWSSIEPLALSRVIQRIEMNSLLWKMVYQWGEFYLSNNNKSNYTVRLLFEENGILSKISLKDFESASSILDFHDLSKKELLDPNEILGFFKNNVVRNKSLPDESSWVKVKKGDKIVEIIKFERPFLFSVDEAQDVLNFYVSSNMIYYYKELNSVIDCSLRYFHSKSSSGIGNWSYGPYLSLKGKLSETTKKEFSCSSPIERKANELVMISHIEITYNFLYDCTILKTSLLNDKNLRSSQICLTQNVKCEGKRMAESNSNSTPTPCKKIKKV